MADAPRVLLVEDDDDTRELMAELLADAGLHVVAASTGVEALAALASGPVSVVVTDVGMPGLGGVELAREVRARAPAVPIVLVTGYGERSDLTEGRGRDFDELLRKPVDPEELVRAVRSVLR